MHLNSDDIKLVIENIRTDSLSDAKKLALVSGSLLDRILRIEDALNIRKPDNFPTNPDPSLARETLPPDAEKVRRHHRATRKIVLAMIPELSMAIENTIISRSRDRDTTET